MPRIDLELSIEEYHAGEGVCSTDLRHIARSPAHYVEYRKTRRSPTPAMILGSVFHCLALEPETFELEYAIEPELDGRTKEGKAKRAEFQLASQGKRIIECTVYETAVAMATSLMAHPLARSLVTGGVAEQSIFWESAAVDGVLCKCRPDFVKDLGDGRYLIVDLKSTEDARQEAFEKSAWNQRYYVQAPYYWDGCTAAFGRAPAGFVFIATEKDPPYAVSIYEASVEMLGAGRDEYRRNLRTYKECMDSGVWPAYPAEIRKLMPPKWAA
jgi:hypothetical protein